MAGPCIMPTDIPVYMQIQAFPENASQQTLKDFRNQAERQHIIATLKKYDGNISQAAIALEVARTYLHRRMLQLNIEKKDYFL
ncbi:MAG: helix-turn-helix domain-containing protein [Bdellovibrionota bacterium]